MASTTIIQATESFHFEGPAGPVSICKGETFHKEAKRLEGISDEAREQNFKPFCPNHDLETATAAPGEKRKARPRQSGGENKSSTKADSKAPPQKPAVEGGEPKDGK